MLDCRTSGRSLLRRELFNWLLRICEAACEETRQNHFEQSVSNVSILLHFVSVICALFQLSVLFKMSFVVWSSHS
jgi:hypothetical protein